MMGVPLASFTMPRRVFADDRTGREVWQVTDGEFECVAAYMESCVFTADDRYLVFASNRSGSWQPYRLELATGRAQQLAEVENGGFRSLNVDRRHGEVYCWSGGGFLAVDVESLAVRRAVDLSRFGELAAGQGGKGVMPALSGDCSLLAVAGQAWAALQAPPARIVLASTDGSNEFAAVAISHPQLLDYHVGHVAICPGDDDVLSFCKSHRDDPWNDGQAHHEKPPHPIVFLQAREYRLSRRSGEIKPLISMGHGYRATHSIWARSGERMFSHRKRAPGWVPTALISVDCQGQDLRVHYETSDHRLGHSQPSPDEQWLVTDSQDLDENILMLAHVGRDEQHLLCWPNMSINSKRPHRRHPALPPHTDLHTHPGFSCTGQYVYYTSDITGRSQVYVVPVADLV